MSTSKILYRNRRFLKYRFETLGTAVGDLKMHGSDKECRNEVTLNWPKRSSRCSSRFFIETKCEVPMYIHRYMSSCIIAMCNFTCDFRTAVASRWFPFDCYHIRFVCRIRDHQIRLSRRRWWTCNKTYTDGNNENVEYYRITSFAFTGDPDSVKARCCGRTLKHVKI